MAAKQIKVCWALVTVLAIIVACIPCQPAGAQARQKPKPNGSQQVELAKSVRANITAALEKLEQTNDAAAAEKALALTFDQVIAFAAANDKQLFRDAACALRLVRLLKHAPQAIRAELTKYLRANPEFAGVLAFLVKFDHDKPAEVIEVVQKLRASHGSILNKYAQLAAAICVVHDRPVQIWVGSHMATSGDPLRLFEYFIANEQRMFFGLQNVPAELLIYVVDSTATVEEMKWALGKYAGDASVGERFFDIKYDYDHFRKAMPKKYLASGFNLPSIHKHGGVCAEQAYFAMSVGKAIGVPAVYAYGQSGTVAHAWVGFLQANNRSAWWNFDTGRYEEYQGVRGQALDPQTRKKIADSYLALLADFVASKQLDRQYAAAMTDAARRLLDLQKRKQALKPASPIEQELSPQRSPQLSDALALLEAGVSASPGYAEGWFTVRSLAAEGALALIDKKRWEGVLYRLCGQSYPDFYLAILGPMIQTVESVPEQNALWNAAFAHFTKRHDLAAQVRLEQAAMWLDAGEAAKAGQCCEDVIARYVNAGPFVIDALTLAERILREAKDGQRILALYERAWSQVKKPKNMASVFHSQSNWYKVGSIYADRLQEAGRNDVAARIRATIEPKS